LLQQLYVLYRRVHVVGPYGICLDLVYNFNVYISVSLTGVGSKSVK